MTDTAPSSLNRWAARIPLLQRFLGACRLQNPCGGMEGKRHDAAQEYYIQAGSSQFADQKAPEIARYAPGGYQKKHKENPKPEADQIFQKAQHGFAQAVQNTGKRAVQVEKRT